MLASVRFLPAAARRQLILSQRQRAPFSHLRAHWLSTWIEQPFVTPQGTSERPLYPATGGTSTRASTFFVACTFADTKASARSFSTYSRDLYGNSKQLGPITEYEWNCLNSDTDALLQSSSTKAKDVISLMKRYTDVHYSLMYFGLNKDGATKKNDRTVELSQKKWWLTRKHWSDPNPPPMQAKRVAAVISCAERIEELLRFYSETSASTGGGFMSYHDDEDDIEIEPYRMALSIWSHTPTHYSGDRAAAILDLWGNVFGGDMTRQPSIQEFDVVLQAYALSSKEDVPLEPSDESVSQKEDSATNKNQYPEERALSTLRLLQNIGMYLVPSLSTVAHVIHALRQVSAKPRGQDDGKNEERTRTAISILNGVKDDALVLFKESSIGDPEQEIVNSWHKYYYIQSCCDVLAMATRALPIKDAIVEFNNWMDVIDACVYDNEGRVKSSSTYHDPLREPDGTVLSIQHLLGNCCNYLIRCWKERAESANTMQIPRAQRLEYICSSARQADRILSNLEKWEDVKVTTRQRRQVANICLFSTHPSIVNNCDAERDILPLIFRAEELIEEIDQARADGKVDTLSHCLLLKSWAQLAGALSAVSNEGQTKFISANSFSAVSHEGQTKFIGKNPAERAENILIGLIANGSDDGDGAAELNATDAYTNVIEAWARSKTGRTGAERALSLFDNMQGINAGSNATFGSFGDSAIPNNRTYKALFKALRYSGSPHDAATAESILHYIVEGNDNMEEFAIKPTAQLFGLVIAALTQSKHHEAAERSKFLFKNLLRLYYETKDVTLLPETSMFVDCLDAIRNQRDDFHRVLKVKNLLNNLKDLYNETNDDKLKADVRLYRAAIGALSSARRGGDDAVQMIKDLFNDMESDSIVPDKACYTSAIIAYSRSAKSELCEELIREMDARYEMTGDEALRPGVQHFTALINAHSRLGTEAGIAKCRAILEEMLDRYSSGDVDSKPNSFTFASMINALWKSGDEHASYEAEELLQMMEESFADGDTSNPPSTFAYTSVINTWARCSAVPNKAARARAILSRAKKQFSNGNVKARPDISMYTGVLNACAYTKGNATEKADALRIVLEVMEEVIESPSLRADSIFYNTALTAYGYLVNNEQQRDQLSTSTFQRCCSDGLLNTRIISTLKKFSPKIYNQLPGSNEGFVKVGSLPKDWTRRSNFKTT